MTINPLSPQVGANVTVLSFLYFIYFILQSLYLINKYKIFCINMENDNYTAINHINLKT